MMGLRILHIAPLNISGVPISFVRAERKLGHESRLLTMAKDRRNYEEDICLDLPLLDFWGTRFVKRWVSNPEKLAVCNRKPKPASLPIEWHPNGRAEHLLVRLRELLWGPRVKSFFREIDFWNFDVYQLDGGLEFYRDGRIVTELKSRGKILICCYTGSDLRTRGVIPAIDNASDLNVTLELDHLELHPEIEHVFFPFESVGIPKKMDTDELAVRIGHAPTNRAAKGTDRIIAAIKSLQSELPIEIDLIEGVPYEESLRRKSRCDIFVDQIGELGYGLNSLEALAMGIPACSCLAGDFEERYPDHPFVVVDEENIEMQLRLLAANPGLRRSFGRKGKKWVQQAHDSVSVVERIHALAGLPAAAPLTF